MAVLNPHPEPELQDEFLFIEITTQQQHFTPEVMSMPQDPFPHPDGTNDVQQQPEWQHQEAPVVGTNKDWMKYATNASRRDTEGGNGRIDRESSHRIGAAFEIDYMNPSPLTSRNRAVSCSDDIWAEESITNDLIIK